MTKEKRLFTSESVTEGHPDKIADQISDAILDAVLEQDPYARVAVETIVNTGLVVVFGEMTTTAYVDIQKVVRDKVKEIGYTRGKYGFDADNLAVMNTIDEQSPDIAQGVNNAYDDSDEIGAGDQGLMFGYATNETPELMPLPIMLAHKLTQKLAEVRKNNTLAYLRPDGKAQVTVEYDEQDKPIRIDTVVVSSQHAPEIELDQLREDIKQHVILEALPKELLDEDTRYLINPTGRFVIGGPHGDSGLCLAEGTLVSMADGSFKEIQDIKLDDEVLTETGTAHVIDQFSNGFKDTRVIDLGGLSLEATHNHPFRVFNEDTHELKWVEAGDLNEGDSVLVKERVYLQLLGDVSLVKIEQNVNAQTAKSEYFTQNDLLSLKIHTITPSQAHTYDITLDDDTHAFVANGFIVHNTGRKIIVDTYGGSARHGGGAFCVDGDTEYLSASGVWTKIKDYDGGPVAQFNDDFSISFVEPLEYVNQPADKMTRIHTEQGLDMALSDNHDVVYLTEKKKRFKKQKVKEIKEKYTNIDGVVSVRGSIPTYANYFYDDNQTGLRFGTDALTRLQVAFCADGTILSKGSTRYPGRIRVIKADKIERLRNLIEETGIDYRETQHADDYTYFYFKPPMINKLLSESFKNPSLEEAEILAEEALYWDGSFDSKIFRTSIKLEADFMQFILSTINGTSASILTKDNVGTKYYQDGKEYVRKSVAYEVHILSRRGVGLRNGGRSTTNWDDFTPDDGRMYCFTVPSGMLYLRRNDRIFITGNSSKDATKVDRSASYMARYIAKNIVAANLADKCEVQLAYAIGVAEPVSIRVDTFGTGKYSESDLVKAVRKVFKTTPGGIIAQLDLRRPIYAKTAAYGHFGRELPEFLWERKDKVDELKQVLSELNNN